MGRSEVWWNNVVMRTFTHQDWLQNFRMCKETFLYICNRLSPELERSDTIMRRPLSVQRRVAVCLWCLATPVEYRTIAHLFGIGRSTVFEIVHETCRVIVKCVDEGVHNISFWWWLGSCGGEFKTKWGVPQCFGAVDGCHIPICAPSNQHTDY